MKKLTVILAVIFTLSVTFTLQAQIKFGAGGGLNFSSVKIDFEEIETKSQTNFVIGGVLELPVYKNLSLQFQPSYIRKGADFKLAGNPLDWIFELNYVEIPILLKMNFGNKYPYLFAGPAVGYLLDAELKTELDGIKFTGDLKDITEKFDYGVSFGAGFEKSLGFGNFFFEARYTLGLSNNQKGGTFEMTGGPVSETMEWDKSQNDYKNNGLQVLAGIKIPLTF